ncbi:hypothetical protein SAMN05216564_11212 [Halopenitus persicus]|uniref:Uncharacterized protein n=2 Tax=Halopenitus persicus TaxID=1048396 RepID=A0A1H3N9D3_9EURY|nr:hypothetical protein SAMN05216564_11212 [Halopenitus persicus]
MPGRPSQAKPLQYIGALVALIALVGYVVFDWRFGETNGVLPLVIGIVCVVIAVGWKLYQRL